MRHIRGVFLQVFTIYHSWGDTNCRFCAKDISYKSQGHTGTYGFYISPYPAFIGTPSFGKKEDIYLSHEAESIEYTSHMTQDEDYTIGYVVGARGQGSRVVMGLKKLLEKTQSFDSTTHGTTFG